MAIHSKLISCTASEVAAMVEGAMRHGTTMEVEGNYVDSHGQSEVGFGITRLLGFDLLPRIKRINKVRLYRPAAGEADAYPRLAPALSPPIPWDIIAEPYALMVQDVLADDDWAAQLTDADRRGLTPLFWTPRRPVRRGQTRHDQPAGARWRSGRRLTGRGPHHALLRRTRWRSVPARPRRCHTPSSTSPAPSASGAQPPSARLGDRLR